MTRSILLTVLLLSAAARADEPRAALSLVTAQPAFATKVTTTGRVHPLISARLGARVAGHIRAWGTDAQGRMLDVGMRVGAGQVLFRLEETTFANAVAAAEAAVASAEAARDNLTARTREEQLEQLRQALAELDVRLADRRRDEERYRRLVEQDKTLPEKRLEEVRTEVAALQAQRKGAAARLLQAENGATKTEIAVAAARVHEAQAMLKIARDDLRDATVKAPFAGLITKRFKGPGDYVTAAPLVEVLELVAADQLEADLRLPESYLPRVAAGATSVRLGSPLLKEALVLPVTRVVGEVDPLKGTFAFRVAIPPEQKGGLVPGAFVTGEVQLDGAGAAVVVPQRAVHTAGGQSHVFVAAGGKLARRPVEVGDRLTEGVILKSGVQPGEKVAIGATETLKDGAALP